MTPFDPPSAAALPARRRLAARKQLEAMVTTGSARRWRVPRVLIGVAAAAVLASGAGTIAYLQARPVANRGEARCYTVASLAGDRFTTIAQATRAGAGPGQVSDAVGVCAALWRQGFLRPGAPGIARHPGTSVVHRVPPLVTCVLPGGTAAVFPGSSRACARLGLPRATGSAG